jgi:hypothetical protein
VSTGVGGFKYAADGADLEALGAAEPPVAGGDALDEGLLDESLGFELGDEIGEEGVKVGLAFVAVGRIDDDVLGEEPVLEGVARGAGLAAGGPGAGGVLGVALVGGALFGGHGFEHG